MYKSKDTENYVNINNLIARLTVLIMINEYTDV